MPKNYYTDKPRYPTGHRGFSMENTKNSAESTLTFADLTSALSGLAGAVSAVAIIISTALAVMMYILVRKNSKQANALQVLRDLENDRDIIQEREKYSEILKALNCESIDDYADKLQHLALPEHRFSKETTTILSALNRYEFIAVGIRTGAIDEKLIRLWTKTAFVRAAAMQSKFMAVRQDKREAAFSELHWLAYKWSKGLDEYRGIIEKNMGKPKIIEINFISPVLRAIVEHWMIIALLAFQTIILSHIL